jgi:hypothetical protein
MSLPIPQPPPYPLLGNITDVDPQNGIASLMHLADKYGEFSISMAPVADRPRKTNWEHTSLNTSYLR